MLDVLRSIPGIMAFRRRDDNKIDGLRRRKLRHYGDAAPRPPPEHASVQLHFASLSYFSLYLRAELRLLLRYLLLRAAVWPHSHASAASPEYPRRRVCA